MQQLLPFTKIQYGKKRLGPINWEGFKSLYFKEVQRFTKVAMQTIVAPVISSLLFLFIFKIAIGDRVVSGVGINFENFLVPGLIMMAIIQNAFANTSSSLLISKVQGNIVDLLMSPLNELEIIIAFLFAGVTRGIVVGIATYLAILPFISIPIVEISSIIFFSFVTSISMASIGLMTGIWAEKFDHMATISNFVIMPLSFLSGTFYSITILPEFFRTICMFNPFFYMIDGFRSGFLGYADGSIFIGFLFLNCFAFLLVLSCYALLKSGYRLRL